MKNGKSLLFATALLMHLAFLPVSALAAEAPINEVKPEQLSSYIQNSVAADDEKETSVKVGRAVEVILRENMTTPYRWHYRVSDEKAIRLLHEYYEPDPNPEKMVGVGGRHYYYFVAAAPGKYDIKFQENRIGDGFPPDSWDLVYKLTVTD